MEREGEYTAMRFVLPHECVARITTTMASRSNQELLLLIVSVISRLWSVLIALEEDHQVRVVVVHGHFERRFAIGRLLPRQ